MCFLAIYGPMIYTAPYVMLLMRADTLRGRSMDLEIKTFLGPVKRYRAVRHIWGPKKSRFPEPNPLPLGQVMDLPASKHYVSAVSVRGQLVVLCT
jgi:hypothetical protein